MAASVAHAAAVRPNGIKTPLAVGVNGIPTFIIGPRKFDNPPFEFRNSPRTSNATLSAGPRIPLTVPPQCWSKNPLTVPS